MNDFVTDAMVEAVAIGLRNRARERVGLSPLDRLPWSPASGEARADARAELEAAAPLIAAKALRDFDERVNLPKEWSERVISDADRIERHASTRKELT